LRTERKIALNFELRAGTPADIDALCAIDDDASELFVLAGLRLNRADEHEFEAAERSRWQTSLALGGTLIALDSDATPIGFAASGTRDGEPYLDQLSVLRDFMRLGVGTCLLSATEQVFWRAGARSLWLTTYAHLSWNRPFYERNGYLRMPERDCGPDMRRELDYERAWLPEPGHRIAMRKDLIGRL
jgi:GNAT superfamily N-acetyltransferase